MANGQNDGSTQSFADLLYEKITSVIGGDNPNQFFTMGLPGTLLNKEDYVYQTNVPKPAVVEANESRLCNKMFDPAFISSGDNGRFLYQQYKTALDMLTPKLNQKLAEAKNTIRELLMTPYPYDFGNGLVTDLSLQQVFFRLYDIYIDEKENFANSILAKQQALAAKYPGNDDASGIKRENGYLEWYETIAETALEKINEKLGAVLSVFAPNDMKILEGILTSGSGAELEEAREMLDNVAKPNPKGGYIYPVELSPSNWFTLLDSSFNDIDLLESPGALAQQLEVLTSQKNNLLSSLNRLTAIVPDNEDVKKLSKAVNDKKAIWDDDSDKQVAAYLKGFQSTVDAALTIYQMYKGSSAPAGSLDRLAGEVRPATKDDSGECKLISEIVGDITDACTKIDGAQSEVINAVQGAADALLAYAKANNMEQLTSTINDLKSKLEDLNAQIEALQTKIKLSVVVNTPIDLTKVDKNDTSDVAPTTNTPGFTQIIITAAASSISQKSSRESEASNSSSGLNFLFGGYASSNSLSSSSFSSFADDESTNIQIGMSVAKVSITRPWFNPGIFAQTEDMYNVTDLRIAPKDDDSKEFAKDEWLKDMSATIFPCFPVAFVIAKDVSIKFVSSSEISQQVAQTVESHAASGGGFFLFHTSKASSSSSSSSSSSVTSNSNSISIKFTDPQILGWYLEATPADLSSPLDNTDTPDTAGFVSIFTFVDKYKQVLKDYAERQKKG